MQFDSSMESQVPASTQSGDKIILSKNEILNLFKNTETDKEWAFEWAKPSDTSKLTHCYHRYPAKFIPQLVERLMDEYLVGVSEPHVNDLFMGSGTTLTCVITRGYKASGTDVNYTAELITRAKCTPIDPIYLEKMVKKFLDDLSFLERGQIPLFNECLAPFIPEDNIERINYWFQPEIRDELGIILRRISLEEDNGVRIFLECCFSHILKTVSIWLMGSSKPTRDLKKKPQKPIIAFKIHLKKMMRGNKEFWPVVPNNVKCNLEKYLNIKRGDAREQPVDDNSVDIQITSSPYVTSYEYADLHQLSTIWLNPREDLREYRKEFIGTAYKSYDNKGLKGEIAKDIVNQMMEKDVSMANEIEAFFIDMQECFDETYRILKPGGRCCYVIGNTALKKVDILNAEAFAESMQYSGLVIDRVIKREIPLKILPQRRDAETGKFAKTGEEDFQAYPIV